MLYLLVFAHARLGLQVPVSDLIIQLVLLFLKAHFGVSEGPQLRLAGIELVLVPDKLVIQLCFLVPMLLGLGA